MALAAMSNGRQWLVPSSPHLYMGSYHYPEYAMTQHALAMKFSLVSCIEFGTSPRPEFPSPPHSSAPYSSLHTMMLSRIARAAHSRALFSQPAQIRKCFSVESAAQAQLAEGVLAVQYVPAGHTAATTGSKTGGQARLAEYRLTHRWLAICASCLAYTCCIPGHHPYTRAHMHCSSFVTSPQRPRCWPAAARLYHR